MGYTLMVRQDVGCTLMVRQDVGVGGKSYRPLCSYCPFCPLTPAEDIGDGRSSEADVDGRSLGEPLVKRERSDPNHPLQGI